MKKLMLLSVVVAFLGISVPQTIAATQSDDVQVMAQDNQYAEIKVTELPATVSKAVSEKYPGFKIDKAFKGTDGSFKVALSKGEEKVSVVLNDKGEFLKSEK